MAKNRPIFKTSSHAGPLKLQPKTLYKKFSEINSTPPIRTSILAVTSFAFDRLNGFY